MKKIFTLLICISLANTALSQNLDIILLDNLTKKSFASLDEYMIEYYGFEKIENNKEELQNTYARTYKNNLDNTIVITVISSKNTSNNLEISLAKNYDVYDIKKQLVSKGYKKSNTINFEYDEYVKDNSTFLVSIVPNEAGKSQIKVLIK